jgi:hypothetical protein
MYLSKKTDPTLARSGNPRDRRRSGVLTHTRPMKKRELSPQRRRISGHQATFRPDDRQRPVYARPTVHSEVVIGLDVRNARQYFRNGGSSGRDNFRVLSVPLDLAAQPLSECSEGLSVLYFPFRALTPEGAFSEHHRRHRHEHTRRALLFSRDSESSSNGARTDHRAHPCRTSGR